MPEIPHDPRFESSAAMLKEGYTYISGRCAELHSDLFQARLLMQNTICLHGEEAARLFYDESRFKREKAAPNLLLKTLLGKGGVQGLDDAEHRQRKRLFLSVLDDAGVERMVRGAEAHWQAAFGRWQEQDEVILLHEVQTILTGAVCDWAGVPLDDVETRRSQLAALIDGAGGIGPRHFHARRARKQAEAWCSDLIRQVRDGRLEVDASCPLAVVAQHPELDGSLMDPTVAAVELLNLLRPTVAVSRFIVFAALELHRHPQWSPRLAEDDRWLEPFAQEVRRVHAFFPFMAARVRQDFEWRGYRFPEGTRVLLDLYGTNRDPRSWSQPEQFQPERFEHWSGNAFSFITQGGGDVTHHRCPGERLSIELIKQALRMLVRDIDYEVPEQDLSIDLSRLPALPESRMILTRVRPHSAPVDARASPQ